MKEAQAAELQLLVNQDQARLGSDSSPAMPARIAAYDWARSRLGPVSSWSKTLRTALELCLGSRMCSCIYWGDQHLIIYNDAYASILGAKHPAALGQPAAVVWPEIFDVIGPLMARTFADGATTGGDDVAIFLNRSGYVEEFYCSFSYAPLRDHTGRIEAVFAILPETSVRVIGERRLRTLQQLGGDARAARAPEETLKIAADVISANPYDIPFAALYTWGVGSNEAKICATAGIDVGMPLSPYRIALDETGLLADAVRRSMSEGYAVIELCQTHQPVPCGAWRESARELIVLTLQPYGNAAPRAIVLAGISPHKALDDEHVAFFRMLADQLRRSLSDAISHAQEDLRLQDAERRLRADQAADRVRIARDLHDTLLQSMQGMRFLLEAGLTQWRAGDPAAINLFENALRASEQSIEEGRQVLSVLRTTAHSARGQRASIEALGSELAIPTDTTFSFDVVGLECEMDVDVWNEAYGICREAVANAARHADASHIQVEVAYRKPFCITITDDGCGLDEAIARDGRPGHFGLPGMRERAANLGGHITIEKSAAKGTRVVLSVPEHLAYGLR